MYSRIALSPLSLLCGSIEHINNINQCYVLESEALASKDLSDNLEMVLVGEDTVEYRKVANEQI